MASLDYDALTDRQRELLEALAVELELDNWTNAPPLRLIAKIMATLPEAARLSHQHPDWSSTRCLDEAEACVLELPTRGKSVSSTLARWAAQTVQAEKAPHGNL